jgi:hypothetical protein
MNELFGKLSDRVDGKLTTMTEKEAQHAQEITNLNQRLQSLEGSVQQTHVSLSSITTNLETTIAAKVQHHMNEHTSTLETNLKTQLIHSLTVLETKHEQRMNQFRHDHQQFVLEFRAAQKKHAEQQENVSVLVDYIKRTDPNTTNMNEIVFQQDHQEQNSFATHENNLDVSFGSQNE